MADQHLMHGGDRPQSTGETEGTERVREVIRDGFYTMLGAASWAFEKTDEMAQTWLRQGRASGELSRDRFDEIAARTRRAGQDLGRRVQDSVRSAGSSMPLATREQVANLERQVAELTRQIESLKSGSSTQSSPPRDRPPAS